MFLQSTSKISFYVQEKNVSNRFNHTTCGSSVSSDDVEIVRSVLVQGSDTPWETPDNDTIISSDQENVDVLEPETEDNISSDPEDSSTLVKSDLEKLWNGETIFYQKGNRKVIKLVWAIYAHFLISLWKINLVFVQFAFNN